MKLTVSHTWPFLFLVGIYFLWWVRWRTASSLSQRHLNRTTVARSALVALLVLALTKPVWHRTGTWVSVVYVLDVSTSVSSTFIDSALQWIASATAQGSPAHARYIAFAANPKVVENVEQLRSLPVSSGESFDGPLSDGIIDQSSTNIESALLRALESFAPQSLKRLVLITDGHQTRGDLSRALWRAEGQGVRVFTVPATVRAEGDSWIEAIEVPDEVRAEEPFEMEVRVFSRRRTAATVELHHKGAQARSELGRKRIRLETGLNQIPFEIRLEETGPVTIEARLEAEGDPFPQNNHYFQSEWADHRPRVLYTEGHSESVSYLRDALRQEGIDVVTTPAALLPETARSLEPYDLMILSDVPAQSLNEGKMLALEKYVCDEGGGLIFIGGETSYGASGYSNTPVEEALPVRFRIQEKKKDVALVITLDKSYSMTGQKIELAKEAVNAAIDLLEESHQFGVVTFDWYPHVTVPLQLATDKSRIKETIGKITASATTKIYPALEKAYEQLTDSEAKVKHVILLSDGKSYPDEFETLVTRMAEERMTVSAVAVGEEADWELLSNIALWGKGRSYFIEDAEKIPEIFIRETQIAVEATLEEEPFRPVLKRRTQAFRGIEFATAPPLRGYVNTLPKDTAEVLLESSSGAPILARWQYGLGKAVAFTSDAKNRWAIDWLAWDGYGKFWSQLVRETMRRDDRKELDFRVQRERDEAVITLTAVDEEGRYRDGIAPEVQIVGPMSTDSTMPIPQVGPGSYEVRFPLTISAESLYEFRLAGPSLPGGTTAEDSSRALFYSYPDEYRLYPPNTELLRAISTQTGGEFDPEIEAIFADHGDTNTRPTPLWPYLASLALVLYLFDIALRRVPWFRE